VPFAPPDEADIPDGPFGDAVRAGLAIFRDPGTHAAPYVGNGLSCTNCHLDDGRRAASAPMWAAYPLYPMYRSKNYTVNTIELRTQGCFRFSMNGTPPPADSEIMVNLVSYFFWLSQYAPIGVELPGRLYPDVPEPAGGYDINRGEALYASYCAACHGADGRGIKAGGGPGYQFPPLWGADSYNWGAGMQKLSTAAGFIKANMPYGLRNALTDQEAWDLASFINSQERPQDPRFTGSVAETRERFHATDSLYGTVQRGVLLGDPASIPNPASAQAVSGAAAAAR
jgi:thiosulfate dehydrogenase